jgi:hypothetical protein
MTAMIEGGRSPYQIVTPGRFTPVENHAAENLQDALYRITGVRLPVRWAQQRLPDRPAILVGSAETEPPALWQRDSYGILPVGRDLVLKGSDRRGTHYATVAFLEGLGARFWGPDCVHLPALDRVDLPTAPTRSTAAFGYRHVFYPTAQVPEWAIRWKLNVHDGRDERWGRNEVAHSCGHSFEVLVPTDRYFTEHPEYFSLVDGLRRDHGQQLCCTNPKVADVACEALRGLMAASPDRRIFSVAMNDWDGWCECPSCAEADRREGGHIGQVLTLVNRVAERFPDRIIATLAYAWALDPPRDMQARDNVLIVYCHNEGCYSHGLEECELNRRYLERLRRWKERARHILIWDYYVNYHSYLMPTPYLRRLEQDLRLYRDLDVDGMFCQGSACRGGQFEGPRQYLLARLLWDPSVDALQVVGEWLRGVYGERSGGRILEYFDLFETHVRRNNLHMPSFGEGQEIQDWIFTPEVLERGKALWDEAEAMADPERLPRIRAARAPEMCSRLFNAGLHYELRGSVLAPDRAPDGALRDRFVQAAVEGGAAHLREDDAAPEAFARNYGRTYDVVTLENAVLRASVIPGLDGRVFSLRYLPLGGELLRVGDLIRHVNFLPYGAGYALETGLPGERGPYGVEHEVVERTGERVVLRVSLADGVVLRTVYALAGQGMEILHEITNQGSSAVRVAPVAMPVWELDAFGEAAVVGLRKADGSWSGFELNPEGRRDRDLRFEGDTMPHGAWRLRSLVLEETFDPREVASTRLVLSRPGGHVDLRLCFAPRMLKPGDTAVCGTRWTVRQSDGA